MDDRQAINQLSVHVAMITEALEYIAGNIALNDKDRLEFCLTLKTIRAEAEEVQEMTDDS